LGLPYRQYIWIGDENEPAQIPDPDFTGEGEAPLIDNPEAWCFVYGEEWMSGEQVMGDDGNLRAKVFSDYRDEAELDESNQLMCN
jgi:hypothetical protein